MIKLEKDTLTKADVTDKLNEIFTRFHGNKQELIPILQETQEQFRYLPEAAMREIARFLHMPESTVYGVSTFYAQFKLTPLGRKICKICRGTACHVRGGAKILEETEKELGIKAGETTEDLEWTLETIACFGSCALAPVMVIDKDVHGRVTPSRVKEVLSSAD
ncbi:NADH-quinone oxidoreductase subunit NuoE [Chloroflexota bacterium]